MHGRLETVNSASQDWEHRWWRIRWGAPVQFDPKVDLGQIVVALVAAGGVTVWAITSATHATDARSDVASLRADMNEQFHQVRLDIANLPDVQAQIVQMNRRLDQDDSRLDAQSKRSEFVESEQSKHIETLEREVIQTRADLDNVIRASQAGKR